MSPSRLPSVAALAGLACAGLLACGPDVGDEPDADTTQDDAAAVDSAPEPDTSTVDSLPADFSRVYVHSGQVLYRLDTTDLEAVEIGAFTNLGTQSMTDIAIDKDDLMIGVTLDRIFTIDEETGESTLRAEVEPGTPNLTSLSFVPVDLDDEDSEEILVAAADDGTVYQIDPDTGVTTMIGSYGSVGPTLIRSSGDIVAVRGAGIYATVTLGDPLTNLDYLATIDPVTWEATPLPTQTGYDKIFGVGYWRNHIYGLVDLGVGFGGAIVELDADTGASTLIDEDNIRWFGAGVTTDAPIID
jgi:hypothetical protein